MNYLIDLFFPSQCQACSSILTDHTTDICVNCRHQLPLTNYHFQEDCPLHHLFYGRIDFVSATSLFYFEKSGLVQKLLHQLKYKRQKSVGTILGTWLGIEMKNSKHFNEIKFFESVGSDIGLLFQIADDLIDFKGNSKIAGKKNQKRSKKRKSNTYKFARL